MNAVVPELHKILVDLELGDFNPTIEWHVRAVAPYGLAPAIQRILEAEGSTVEEYEEARKDLLKACIEKWKDI